MISQLCESTFFQEWGLLIILVVFLVFMLIFSASKRKKESKMAEDFANNLKTGDKIKTYSGIYGTIISIKDTPNGKIAVIETGEGKNVSYMSIDVYAIYNIETPVNGKKGNKAEAVEDKKEEPKAVVEPNETTIAHQEDQEVAQAADEKKADEEEKKADKEDKKTNKEKKTKKTDNTESEFDKLKNKENK